MAAERKYLLSKHEQYSRDECDSLRFAKSESVLFTRIPNMYMDSIQDSTVFQDIRLSCGQTWTGGQNDVSRLSAKRDKTFATSSLPFKCVVVFVCLFNVLLSMGFAYSLSVLFAQLIRVFETDRALVTLNQSFYEAFLAIGGVLWTYPVSRLGYGNCVIIGGISGSACIAFSYLATSVPTVIVLVGILSGASFGILYASAFVVASDVFEKQKEAVIGFVSVGASLGQFSLSYLMEACIAEYGWHGALLIIGGVCLNSIPCGMIMSIQQRSIASQKTNGQDTSPTTGKKNLFKLSLFKEKVFLLLMVNSVAQAFSILAEGRFLVDIAELKGFERREGALLVSVIGIGNLIGGIFGSGSKLLCKIASTVHMSIWMLFLTASHAMVVYLGTYTGLMAAAIVNGICIGVIFAHIAVTMYELYGEEDYAPAFATWNVHKGVGNFLGGFVGGMIYDYTGSYDLLFWIAMILNVFCSISFAGISIWGKRSRKEYSRL